MITVPPHLERSETWNGLRAGDPVAIDAPRLGRARFEFRAYVRNTRTGAESVEVVGGREGDRAIRSFRPDQVYPASSPRQRPGSPRASLAQAPRLPFG